MSEKTSGTPREKAPSPYYPWANYTNPEIKYNDYGTTSTIAKALNNPQLQSLMKQLNIQVAGPIQLGNGIMTFAFIDNGSTISGLDRKFTVYMEDGLGATIIARRLMAGAEGRMKLKEALKNPDVMAKIKEYKININDIQLVSLGFLERIGYRLWKGGAEASDTHIDMSATLTVEQMVKELVKEIPKFAKLKSDHASK